MSFFTNLSKKFALNKKTRDRYILQFDLSGTERVLLVHSFIIDLFRRRFQVLQPQVMFKLII
jgi:hypothetical protein